MPPKLRLHTIADRLGTVSLSNDTNQTGVVKPVYGIPTFPLIAKAVKSKGHVLKFVNNSPCKDRGPTANHSGEVTKIITQTCKVVKTGYQKYIKTSARAGYAPAVWKRAQVHRLKEPQLTIRGDKDQDLVSYEVVWTSPGI